MRQSFAIYLLLILSTMLSAWAVVNGHIRLALGALMGSLLLNVGVLLFHQLRVRRFSQKHLGHAVSGKRLFKQIESVFSDQESQIKKAVTALASIGETDADTRKFPEGELGQALITLKERLSSIREAEQQRSWAAQGIATLSEIRKDNNTLEDYGYSIISSVAKLMQANQAAFYVQRDETPPFLELLATYAYGRRKYTSEKVTLAPGTGLVGQCALGVETILLKEIPKDYVKITSGLGEALPRNLVLTPMSYRGEVFGVIELASFTEFKTHQLDLLSKVCEIVAVELGNVRAQEKTRRLQEESKEEELKRSLDEMKAAQQQMLMKEEELQHQLQNTRRAVAMATAERNKNEAILEGCMDAVISFNQDGVIEYLNKAAEDIFGCGRAELTHKPITDLLNIRISDDGGAPRVINYSGNEVTVRTEIDAFDRQGEEMSLLLTATRVRIEGRYLFTVFAQKVSVELF